MIFCFDLSTLIFILDLHAFTLTSQPFSPLTGFPERSQLPMRFGRDKNKNRIEGYYILKFSFIRLLFP